MSQIPVPDEPLRVAIIGTGTRSQTVYKPLLPVLEPWVKVAAVCDPVKEHADAMADELGVPAYYDIRQLAKDRPMEAAIIITPVPSHHSLSVFMSDNGIHSLCETTWCSMVCQARDMIGRAREKNLVVRVAENFFRFPVDRFSQAVRDSGYLGCIGRIFSYADHTGYHNNSRWIAFAGCRPDWVQCIEHEMAHPAFYSMPQRRHETEALKSRFFHFPNDFVVMDTGSGHVKGHLGRHPRPGYTEWHGERGTMVYRASGAYWGGEQGELRRVSDQKLAPAQVAAGNLWGGGVADEITPVVMEKKNGQWMSIYADTPTGLIEYVNPNPSCAAVGKIHMNYWYGDAIIGHVIDFALAVRGLKQSEFDEEDAMMSLMMELGARESALNEGRRIRLPLEGDLEADALTRASEREKFGVDPLDVEAMLAVSFPRP